MSNALRFFRDNERYIQMTVGGLLVWRGLSRRSLSGLIVAAAGGSVIRSGWRGQRGMVSQLCDSLERLQGRPAADSESFARARAVAAPTPKPVTAGSASREEDHHGAGLRDKVRDRVDEASWESFPASDPPAF